MTSAAQKEHRRFVRYRLCLPVLFMWNDEKGRAHRGEGLSRDISIHGLYVWSDIQPPSERNLMVEVFLPGLRSSSEPPLCMETEARVMRVDERKSAKSSAGFALAGEQLTVLEPEFVRS